MCAYGVDMSQSSNQGTRSIGRAVQRHIGARDARAWLCYQNVTEQRDPVLSETTAGSFSIPRLHASVTPCCALARSRCRRWPIGLGRYVGSLLQPGVDRQAVPRIVALQDVLIIQKNDESACGSGAKQSSHTRLPFQSCRKLIVRADGQNRITASFIWAVPAGAECRLSLGKALSHCSRRITYEACPPNTIAAALIAKYESWQLPASMPCVDQPHQRSTEKHSKLHH